MFELGPPHTHSAHERPSRNTVSFKFSSDFTKFPKRAFFSASSTSLPSSSALYRISRRRTKEQREPGGDLKAVPFNGWLSPFYRNFPGELIVLDGSRHVLISFLRSPTGLSHSGHFHGIIHRVLSVRNVFPVD